ncbi:Senescence-specific cysteine protease SAG39 [Bienertia sinuspersici]
MVKINGYKGIPQHNETVLKQAVSQQPVSIGITASDQFHSYQSGNIDGDINHDVAIIGYGTETDRTKYWLLKSSWGES